MWITYHLSKDSVYVKFARYNLKISHHLLFVITDLGRTLYMDMFMIHLHAKFHMPQWFITYSHKSQS